MTSTTQRWAIAVALSVLTGVAVGVLLDSATVGMFAGAVTAGSLLGLAAAASAEGFWPGLVMTAGAAGGGIGVLAAAASAWDASWPALALGLAAFGVLHQAIGEVVAPHAAARVLDDVLGTVRLDRASRSSWRTRSRYEFRVQGRHPRH